MHRDQHWCWQSHEDNRLGWRREVASRSRAAVSWGPKHRDHQTPPWASDRSQLREATPSDLGLRLVEDGGTSPEEPGFLCSLDPGPCVLMVEDWEQWHASV